MELPMMQQAQQESAPQQGAAQPNNKETFPASKEEAMKFSNDIAQIMYTEKIYDNTVNQLENIKEIDKGTGMGTIAGQIVGNRLADVRAQTGRKIDMRFAMEAIKATTKTLVEMARDNKIFEPTRDDVKKSLQTSVKIIDRMSMPKKQGAV